MLDLFKIEENFQIKYMQHQTPSLTEPIEPPAAVVKEDQEEIKSPQVKQEPCQQVTTKQKKIEEDPPMETQLVKKKITVEVESDVEVELEY